MPYLYCINRQSP